VSPATIANLERTMRAFVALVTKLEAIGDDPEFRYVFTCAAMHGPPYLGPTWEKELAEAQACLREAKALSSSPSSPNPEVPRAAISPRASS
jgi:hypothetical protein